MLQNLRIKIATGVVIEFSEYKIRAVNLRFIENGTFYLISKAINWSARPSVNFAKYLNWNGGGAQCSENADSRYEGRIYFTHLILNTRLTQYVNGTF